MNNLKTKKLLIFGTGAVGGYYGGMLVKAGFDITFIARGKNLEALKNNGLTLIINGKKENFPINVLETLHATSLKKTFDYIFICVKSMDTKDAALKIKNNVGYHTNVLSFQNGVDNEEIIGEVIGIDKVIGSSVYVTSKQVAPGVIDQFGYNAVMFGELDKSESKRVSELKSILESSGIVCVLSKDILGDLWNKLVWNASFNPVSVLTEKTVDKMLSDKETFELIKNIMLEVKNVALAHGIGIRPDTVEFNINRSKNITPNATLSQDFKGFKTSMLQDFERGKPIELEEIVGVVIRKAKEKNVSVPNIFNVYTRLKEKVKNQIAI
ncbi:MAG: 2-dehydropantoate 2-reductase [Candidatus Melainabacteria bacterium]|nr:2-dehydropantoate 2-reductase [Candidatus Melainabacteria bacterium]